MFYVFFIFNKMSTIIKATIEFGVTSQVTPTQLRELQKQPYVF